MKTFIFDFDDTLVNTSDFIKNHIINITKQQNYPINYQLLNNIILSHTNFESIFNKLFGEELGQKFLSLYKETSHIEPYTPLYGSINIIEYLKSKNYIIGILTNRSNKTIERLNQAGFNQNDFSFILNPKIEDKKPSPKAFHCCNEYLNINTTYYIGDRVTDYLSTLNHNITFTAILDKYGNSKLDFIEAGLDEKYIFSNLNHFQLYLMNHNDCI